MTIDLWAGLGWGLAGGLAVALLVALFAQPTRNMTGGVPRPDARIRPWPNFGKRDRQFEEEAA